MNNNFCGKCGNAIYENDSYCSNCNAPQYSGPVVISNQSSSTAALAIVFAFLLPIVGFILGVSGIFQYKNKIDLNNRILCIVAIFISLIPLTVVIIFLIYIFTTIPM